MHSGFVSNVGDPAPAGAPQNHLDRSGNVEALPAVRSGPPVDLGPSEEIYRIAARLVLSMRANERIIACTGIAADDPSAQFALSTGVALARLGYGPLLVIDANLRSPTMHHAIGARRSPGHAELLQDSSAKVTTVRATDEPNLRILTAGEHPHVTPAMLASALFYDPFESYRRCRYVVMDVGPMLLSAESLMMASAADVIVASLAAGRRTRKAVLRLRDEVGLLKARFLGVVLTDIE